MPYETEGSGASSAFAERRARECGLPRHLGIRLALVINLILWAIVIVAAIMAL